MDKEINSKSIEHDKRVYSAELREEVDVIHSLHLEGEEQFWAYLQQLQESQLNMAGNEEDDVMNAIKNLLSNQIYLPETYSFYEFVDKLQEYSLDIIQRMRNQTYESELITSNNLLYTYGLYRKYMANRFDDFISEIRKTKIDKTQVRKSLLPYSEFERWLFYHAYSMCYHEGMEMPDYFGVNDLIRSKPYGDSQYYPQNEIWQIVSEVGTRHSKGWRDYFCELAIRKYKRKNLKPDEQVAVRI